MSFPRFLGPATVLSLPPGTGAAAQLAVGGFAGGAQTLNFVIQQQIETNWCWAAVSTSVSLFYDPQSMWKQCGVAEKALSRNDCCSDPAAASDPGRCNSPWYLDKALIITGNLNRMESRRLAFNEVQAEIAAKKPIGCRVGWYGGERSFSCYPRLDCRGNWHRVLRAFGSNIPQQPNSVRGFCIFLSKWRGLDA